MKQILDLKCCQLYQSTVDELDLAVQAVASGAGDANISIGWYHTFLFKLAYIQ